jgi:hypothetical protein
LKNQLDDISSKCEPIDCPSLSDTTPSIVGSTKHTILPFDPTLSCTTDPVTGNCPSNSAEVKPLTEIAGDPYTAITNGDPITAANFMAWFCNPNKEITQEKIDALNTFTGKYQTAYACTPVSFQGQP